MTEGNDYIDWDTVARSKPFGLWFLQAYFLLRSSVLAFVAYTFLSHASSLPFGVWLLPSAAAALYIVGIAAAQGSWRHSRAVCIALMLSTIALELIGRWSPATPGPADQLRLELENDGQRLGADLANTYGLALQVVLLLYLVFSRHVREFIKRRSCLQGTRGTRTT